MRILVKIPCRERPQKLLKRIVEYQSLADDKTIQYLVSLDLNDSSCTSPYMLGRLQALGCKVFIGQSRNKVDACNRDIGNAEPWDILVLASDDMECVEKGWDTILKYEMVFSFPDTDGVLWHWDGDPNTKGRLNTMCIVGFKYYNRFGYLYENSYKSLFCDNEFTEVSQMLKKVFYSDSVLFKHVHFSNTRGLMKDALMNRTQSYYTVDRLNYELRKKQNYGILAE